MRPFTQASDDIVSGSTLTENVIPETQTDLETKYQAIANDRKYEHFIHIPGRIIRCLDYFRIGGDRELIAKRLLAYYLFIGVVDNAFDSGQINIGPRVIELLDADILTTDPGGEFAAVALVTKALRCHIHDQVILPELRKLHRQVVKERAATSIEAYIRQRLVVGSRTADLSYLLIRPLLSGKSDSLRRFMKQVGAIGCLIDSVIDLRGDQRHGLLAFTPALGNYTKLMWRTAQRGVRLSFTYPGLIFLFVQAIVDNVRDFTGRRQTYLHRPAGTEGKDRAASVA
jgi:hypothetical protein